MKLLLAIRDDLVEKRLWPVALVLLVALVGLPVVLSRSSAHEAPPVAQAPGASAPAQSTDPAAAERVVLTQTRTSAPKGPMHDPFRHAASHANSGAAAPTGVAKTVTPAPAATPAASSPSASGAGGSAVQTALGPGAATITAPSSSPSAPSTPTAGTPPVAPQPTGHAAGYRVDVGWGPVASPTTTRDAARMTRLKAGTEPTLVLLGVRHDGRTAVFLVVSAAVTATGDGRCRPTPARCRIIELREGDSDFLDVPGTDGITQYELHLDRLTQRRTATVAAARRARARVSRAGRKLAIATLRSAPASTPRFAYDRLHAVLLAVTAKARTSAAQRSGAGPAGPPSPAVVEAPPGQ